MIGIDTDELTSVETLTAYIAVWAESRRDRGFTSPSWAGSYGIVLLGGGRRQELWASGYSTSDDCLRAFAAQRVLKLPSGFDRLVIHTKGLLDHVRAPDGHVRKARRRAGHVNSNGDPYDLFAVYDKIANALDEGHCELKNVRSREEPDQYRLAETLAKGIGREMAIKLKPLHWHAAEIEPRNAILATDADPDPYGLATLLDAAE